MNGVNKVFLLGNLGSTVNLRHLPDGRMVANVNIATTESWRDQSGEKQKHTEWHRLNFFGRQAEIASQYMKKGSQIFVEGKLRTRTWQDREGVQKQTTEIQVIQFQMVGGKQSDGGDRPPAQQQGDNNESKGKPAATEGPVDDLDDIGEDIPW